MADISTRIIINARDEASATLKQIGQEAEGLEERWGSMQDVISAGFGLAGVAGVSFGLDTVIQDAAEFQTAVNDIGKVTDSSLSKIGNSIKQLDASLGSSTQLAQGYYQVMSAGITNAAEAQDMLVVASKVAKTSGISQAEAINALAKIMNGYSGELKSAEQAANMFFATEKLGMTTVAELAPVMGDLAGVAKTLGISHNELAASMAVVTQTSGSTATAATRINALFMEMSRPTDNLTKLYKEMGVASGEALIKTKGLPEALKTIEGVAARTGQRMSTVFGSQEGYQAFLKLMEDNFGKLKQYSDEVEKTSDAMSNAWGRYTQSVNGQFEEIANRTKNLSVTMGESLGGATLAGLQGLNSGLGLLSENFETVKAGGIAAGAGLAALITSRNAYNSAMLADINASRQELGVRGALNQAILNGNAGLAQQVANTNLAAQASLRATEVDVLRLQQQKMLLLTSERHADRLASRMIGTQNEARAEQMLARQRANLVAVNGQLAVAENALTAAQTNAANASRGLSAASIAMAGAKKAAGGLVAMLGGPWGAAFTVAAAGATYLAMKEDEGAKFAREHADAMSMVTGNAGEAASAMTAYAESIRTMTESQRNFEIAATEQNIDGLLGGSLGGLQQVVSSMTTMFSSLEEVQRISSKFQKLTPQEFARASSGDLRTMIEDVRNLGVEFGRTSEAKSIIENLLNPLLAARLKLDALTQSAKPAADGISGMASAATAAYAPLSSLKEILDVLGKTQVAPSIAIGPAVEQLQKDLQGTKALQDQMQSDTKTRIEGNLKLYGQQLEIAREEQSLRVRLAAVNPDADSVDYAERARNGAAELAKAEAQYALLGKAAGQFGEKAESGHKTAGNSAKAFTAELAKLQLTDAQYQQWQASQKIAELEKTLGKANPKVKELSALLQNELEAKFLESITEYADPAAAQIAKVQKEYKKILDTVNSSKNLNDFQKKLFNTQAAAQYEKALEGVAGTTQSLAKISREQEKAEAELSGNRTRWWEIRREELEEQYGMENNLADKGQVRAAVDRQLQIERLQKESENSQTFAKLWEETYKRVDEAGADMIEGFLTGSKNGLDSFKNMFVRTLAEMANAALLRPITVSVMGAMGGVLGGAFGGIGSAIGTANAAGQMMTGSGGMGNLGGAGNLTSFMPSGMFDGITNTINNTMSSWFPGTFGSGALASGANIAGAGLSGVSFMGGSAATSSMAGLGGVSFMNGTGSLAGGVSGLGGVSFMNGTGSLAGGGLPSFTGMMGPALGAGALGGLGYSMLGGMIGLPQSKYSGLTSSLGGAAGWGLGSLAAGALAGGGGMLAGAAAGSVIPVVGTILGALGGGLLGSLFGGERKSRPSMSTQIINTPIDSEYDYTKAFTNNAWFDRAGSTEANKLMPILGEAATTSAKQIEALVAALPNEFRDQVDAKIKASVFEAGPNTPGMDKHNWNLQFYDEDQLKERLEQVVKDIQMSMGKVAQEAMSGIDVSSMYNFDLSSSEGMDKAVQAVTSVKEITEATKEITDPTTAFVAEAKAAKAQMNEWTASMVEYGVTAEYAKEVTEGYRQANIDAAMGNINDATNELLNPTSQFVQQAKAAKEQMEDWIAGMKEYGADENTVSSAVGGYKQANIDVAMQSIADATKAILEPTSQLEQQAQASKKQMEEWIAGMKEYGASMGEVTAAVDEYQRASITATIDALEASINPLSQYEQAHKTANSSVDERIASLHILGATEDELARVEGMRAQVIESMLGPMTLAFEQDLRIREAQLSGNADLLSSTQQVVQHERELADVRAKFGAESDQYAQILNMQVREQAKALEELATAAARAAQELATAKRNFRTDYDIRTAEVGGQDTSMMRLVSQQETEIQQIISKFGVHSKEYFDMLTLHGLEYNKSMLAAAESTRKAWDAATAQIKSAEQAILQYTYDMVDQLAQKMRDVLQSYVDQAQNIYDQAQTDFEQGLRREMDKLSSSIDGFSNAVKDMRGAQKDIWKQNVTPEQSYSSLAAEMQSLYAKAAGGDVDAAGEFSSLVSRWLEASYQSQSDFSGYDKDRIDANKMLSDLSGIFDGQKSEAQKQLDALQSIYDALVEPEKSMDKLLIELIAARAVLDKTLNQQGDYYGKWQLGDLHNELGQIDFSTIKGSQSVADYIQKNGKDAIAHLLGLSGDLGNLEDATVKNLLDMIGGVDNLDSETKKQTGLFDEKLTENIHELYSSIQSLQALELELSKATRDKMDAISKYGPLQINNKLDELKNALVAAISNRPAPTPPSGGGSGGGSTTPAKPTGSLSQSQILTYYRPDVAESLSNGTTPSFSDWWNTHGKKELASAGVSWDGYEGSSYHSTNYLGSKYATQALLLEAKVQALNNSAFEGRRNWTEKETRAVIEKNGGWSSWYKNYGKAEGFASGGTTVPGVRFEANEGGQREVFLSPIAQGVLSSDDSKRTMDAVISMGRLLQMPAAPADSQAALLREIRGLREDNAKLRNELVQVRKGISQIETSTRKSNERLAKWDNDGLPKETVQ